MSSAAASRRVLYNLIFNCFYLIESWCSKRTFSEQGFALRKIARNPEVPNHEFQGAQHNTYMKKVSLSGRPRQKLVAWGIREPLEHSPAEVTHTSWTKIIFSFWTLLTVETLRVTNLISASSPRWPWWLPYEILFIFLLEPTTYQPLQARLKFLKWPIFLSF